MSVPDTERHSAEQALAEFCEHVPPHVRDQLTYGYRWKGSTVELFERRPAFSGAPGEFSELAIARFRWTATRKSWTLLWCDRNSNWHRYDGFEDVRKFSDLMAEVDRDPTCIFFG